MSGSLHLVCPHCNTTNRVPADRLGAEPVCGRCQKALIDGHPPSLGEDAFEAQVAKSDLPVVVDFWAPWCGPCRMMAPAFEQASEQMKLRARFVKVNTDEEEAVSRQFAIRSIPTLAVFKGGREIARQSGAMSAGDLVRWVNSVI